MRWPGWRPSLALAGLTGWVALGDRGAADWIGPAVKAVLFVLRNAAAIERTLMTLSVVTMAGLAFAGGLYLGRAPARAVVALALALGAAASVAPSPAEALEARSGMEVAVGPPETIQGTLVAAAETVRIDGTVDGDLIVAAARVDVRGTVRGDLVVAASTVDVTGTVEGSAYVAAGALTLRGRVARGLYAATRGTLIDSGARVGGDVTIAARAWRSAARWGAVRRVRPRGGGERPRRARPPLPWRSTRGARSRACGGGRPGRRGPSLRRDDRRRRDRGRPRAHARPVPGRCMVRRAARVVLGGDELLRRGAARLGGSRLAPGLVLDSADSVWRWGRSLGWGVATLIGGPIAILLLAVTLVGLPLALTLLGLYLLALYAGKIVVGLALGRRW